MSSNLSYETSTPGHRKYLYNLLSIVFFGNYVNVPKSIPYWLDIRKNSITGSCISYLAGLFGRVQNTFSNDLTENKIF